MLEMIGKVVRPRSIVQLRADGSVVSSTRKVKQLLALGQTTHKDFHAMGHTPLYQAPAGSDPRVMRVDEIQPDDRTMQDVDSGHGQTGRP